MLGFGVPKPTIWRVSGLVNGKIHGSLIVCVNKASLEKDKFAAVLGKYFQLHVERVNGQQRKGFAARVLMVSTMRSSVYPKYLGYVGNLVLRSSMLGSAKTVFISRPPRRVR